MRILQIVPSISLIYGGPSQMVLGLSEALARQEAEVTILTTDSNGDTGQAPLEVPLDRPVEQHGYQIRYFRCSPFRRYKFSLGLLQWLWQNAPDYDVAHIHALFSPVSSGAATVARSRQLPYLLRPLGTLDPADLKKKQQLKKIYAALLERPNLAGSAGIHFTSPQEAKVSERFGTTPPDYIIPLGVKLPQIPPPGKAREKWGIPQDLPIVLFMSRIDPKKGLDLLIPALEKLLQQGEKFHFVLAGTNPQDPNFETQIQQQIQNSPLNSCTTITGFVTGELKAQLLRDADIFTLPSYYENFGIAVAEALAYGVPVVISDQVHIWEDIAQANGGWICHCEVESLTQSLQMALQQPQERQQRGQNAQQLAQEKYSWEAIARQTLEVYQAIVTSH